MKMLETAEGCTLVQRVGKTMNIFIIWGRGAEFLVKSIPGRPIRRKEDEIPKCFRLIRSL